MSSSCLLALPSAYGLTTTIATWQMGHYTVRQERGTHTRCAQCATPSWTLVEP